MRLNVNLSTHDTRVWFGMPLVKSAYEKIFILFLNKNICCVDSKNYLNEKVFADQTS